MSFFLFFSRKGKKGLTSTEHFATAAAKVSIGRVRPGIMVERKTWGGLVVSCNLVNRSQSSNNQILNISLWKWVSTRGSSKRFPRFEPFKTRDLRLAGSETLIRLISRCF